MLLAIGNDGQFQRFCAAAGQPSGPAERFATNTLRVKHRAELIPAMEAVTRTRTTADWITLLEDKAVPCGPINTIAQAFDDAQVRHAAGRIVAALEGWRSGRWHHAHHRRGQPGLRLSATPPVLRNAPPPLGQHTDEVLRELGLDADRIAALRAAKAI